MPSAPTAIACASSTAARRRCRSGARRSSHASEADQPFDLAFVATQSTTLEAALTDARPRLSDGAVVVTCQNGLPEDRARAVVGERVVGCVVGWGASMIEPGHYKRTSKGVLTLRAADGGVARRAARSRR